MTTLQVFDCPSCGAPLPGTIGQKSTCAHCGTVTPIESGGAAELKAREARAEAEAVFAKLGKPPSRFARIAVVLANPWVWGLGFPFAASALMRLGRVPLEIINPLWERAKHERLLHVVHPSLGWLLEVAGVAVASLVLLTFSLLGKRVDARRDLQAALASKPPTTPGGKSSCRNCNAPLEVAPGALGVRCASCGADNLVMLTASWVARAKKMAETLRVSTKLAKAQEKEGLRRLGIAALWRVPMVALVVYFVVNPALERRHSAGWDDVRIKEDSNVGLWRRIKREPDWPTGELMGFARCGVISGKYASRLDASATCELGACELIGMVPLARGDRLRVEFVGPPSDAWATLRLAPRDFLGETGVLWDGFGDQVGHSAVPFEVPVEISGWYKLIVRGNAETMVQPCVVGPAK